MSSWSLAMQLAFAGGDLPHALEIVQDATRALDPVEILDDVLAPAMCHVGLLWERDMLTVADEHLATATAHRLLAAVAPMLDRDEPDSRPLALLAAPASERHTTPLLMAEAMLRGAGHRIRNLGAGVPLPALLDMAEKDPPALVCLSSTMPAPDELRATTAALREALPDARIVVGGRSVPLDPGPAEPVADMSGLRALLG